MKRLLPAACLLLLTACAAAPPPVAADGRPLVEKLGTVGVDLCETSPFVFKGKPYRLEWHRNAGRLRIMDHDTQAELCHFGDKHRFPCVFVKDDTVYVYGTKEDRGWFGNTLTVFTSKDLAHWDEQVAFSNKDYGICNTSVCRADGRYLMSIEVNAFSKKTNGTFACRFLESQDLVHWTLTPEDCRQGFDRGLCSPHLIRYHDGWHYLFSTVGGQKPTPGFYGGYVMILNRSRDLKTWEPSPFNPVLNGTDDDKKILNPGISEAFRADIANNAIRNNSDMDIIPFKDRLIIDYCWGTQGGKGHEYAAEAVYRGTEAQFLEGWFPKKAGAAEK